MFCFIVRQKYCSTGECSSSKGPPNLVDREEIEEFEEEFEGEYASKFNI